MSWMFAGGPRFSLPRVLAFSSGGKEIRGLIWRQDERDRERQPPPLSQTAHRTAAAAADGERGGTQIFNGLCDAAISSPLSRRLGELLVLPYTPIFIYM